MIEYRPERLIDLELLTSPFVYAVHAVRPEDIWSTEVVWTMTCDAEEYAGKLSNDPGVLAGAVTRFTLDRPGERHPVALYVSGARQELAHVSDDRRIYANGWAKHPSLRRRLRRS
ncbi:hypothetical protein [Pseudonocardia acaciae]|uniref:hypothetical protein n=1 Tax=Pseudonocardia acaciae TaxID=551276 RepID=UPI00048DDD2D|nr:hypothetical protein [Pseudonocardia acaciae]